MADLEDFLTSLLTGLTRARQAADLESALIAEEYQRHPLLAGLGAPRVRIADMTVEVPVGIVSATPGTPGAATVSAGLATEIARTAEEATASSAVAVGPSFREDLETLLSTRLERLTEQWRRPRVRQVPTESISRLVQDTVQHALLSAAPQLQDADIRPVLDAVRQRAFEIATHREVDATGKRAWPGVTLQIATDELRELSPDSITRIRVVVKEEGLEWTSQRTGSGLRHTLTPE